MGQQAGRKIGKVLVAPAWIQTDKGDEGRRYSTIAIGQKNGFKPDEVKNLIANSPSSHFHLPENDSERFDQIYDLVEMMLADGIVDDDEMEFCMAMAAKLGFRRTLVGVLVRKITMGVKDGLSRDHIKKEFQSFMNI